METQTDKPVKKSLRRRIFTIAHLNLFMVLVLVGFTAYTLFAPITPATLSTPIVQDVNNLRAGAKLTYSLQSCRYVGEGVVTTVTRKLVSTTDKQLAPIILSADTVTNPPRCLDTTRTLIVPETTPAGNYQLVITGIYQVIPLRKPITVITTSASFDLGAVDLEKTTSDNSLQSGNTNTPISGGSGSTAPKPIRGQNPAPSTITNNTTNNNTTVTPPSVIISEEPAQGPVTKFISDLTGIDILFPRL
jgi:hypothetical protein